MAINMGSYTDTNLGGSDEQDNKEVVENKYTGEQFEIERNTDFITILPNIINPLGCEHILNVFHGCPIDEDSEYNPDSSEIIPSQKVQDHNLSYKYIADMNKTHLTCSPGTREFDACLEVFEHLIPDHPDFDTITYMQVVHYAQDSMFPFHKDVAEDTDFGTMILQLNEGYKGGRLIVDGNYIAKNEGTATFFNNSTQMWHGVEPVYEGDRYVLLVWFGRDEDSMRGEEENNESENNDSTDSEMQSVSETTETTGSEVPLTDE